MVTQTKIPSWLSGFLQTEGISRIESAVELAERTTSAEIVPMIVRRSSAIGHVPIILFSFFTVFIAIEAVTLPFEPVRSGIIILVTLILAGVASILLSKFSLVQRLLTVSGDRISQTQMRAEVEFFEAGLDKTAERTGILIFVSLMEHTIVVLGDKSISDKLAPEVWQNLVGLIVRGIKGGRLAEGMCEAIAECQRQVTPHFPIQNTHNELYNKLIIKE